MRINKDYHKNQKALLKLKGNEREYQLICLLHGPGGSGKSIVLNTVIAYATEYCHKLRHSFTSKTVVVTAMSGVAAMLLHGQTTHKALCLNCKSICSKEIKKWANARLLIINEISFASKNDILKMEANICVLMTNKFTKYGGLNIVLLVIILNWCL